MNNRVLSVSDVIQKTGIKREQLNLLRQQKYVLAIQTYKGSRRVFVFSEEETEKIERIAKLMSAGHKPSIAAALAQRGGDANQVTGAGAAVTIPGVGSDGDRRVKELQDALDGEELGSLLQAICLSRMIPPQEINERFLRWLSGQPEQEWRELYVSIETRLKKKESGTVISDALRGHDIHFVKARSLAQTLSIHTLLLDPLFSQIDSLDRHVMSWDTDFLPVGDRRDKEYGYRGEYRVPWLRLRETSAVFGLLTLNPGGKSDIHSHPGDELMLCLSGEVTVRMEDTGVDTVLKEGDYIHFYAEQIHSAVNVRSNKIARLFIIRFYQVNSPSKRPDRIPHSAQEFKDLSGLGHFLKQMREMRNEPGYQNVISRYRKKIRDPRRDADLERALLQFEEGRLMNAEDTLLKYVVASYDVLPILIENYRYPAFQEKIVVKGMFDQEARKAEIPKLPGAHEFRLAKPDGGHGVDYWIPCRNLFFSDITIVVLDIAPGGSTQLNKHPGFELSLPIRGSVTVKFNNGDELTASRSRSEFVHYCSDRAHEVCNCSEDPCSVFVVRFSPRWGR